MQPRAEGINPTWYLSDSAFAFAGDELASAPGGVVSRAGGEGADTAACGGPSGGTPEPPSCLISSLLLPKGLRPLLLALKQHWGLQSPSGSLEKAFPSVTWKQGLCALASEEAH